MRRDECNLNLEVDGLSLEKKPEEGPVAHKRANTVRTRMPQLRTIPGRLSIEIKEKVNCKDAESEEVTVGKAVIKKEATDESQPGKDVKVSELDAL